MPKYMKRAIYYKCSNRQMDPKYRKAFKKNSEIWRGGVNGFFEEIDIKC